MKIKGEEVSIVTGVYGNGRTALQLMCDEGPYATVTVNMPDEVILPGEVIIKNHSENEGMLKELQKNGIVGPTKRMIHSGYVSLHVVDLLMDIEK